VPLGLVIFTAVFIAIFGVVLLLLAANIRGIFKFLGMKAVNKSSYDAVKFETYECGIPVENKKDSKMSVKFYLTAILFIIFDIEIIFMYPWAVTFRDFINSGNGGYILAAMGFFLSVFIFGLWWEVKSKALEWD
jgi:NADH-quinone oxidoreductase subunit A